MGEKSKERPLLMSGEMVRATLAGTKTQTRRPVAIRKPKNSNLTFCDDPAFYRVDYPVKGFPRLHVPFHHPRDPETQIGLGWDDCGAKELAFAPAEIGDRLWVRETFGTCPHCACLIYRADWKDTCRYCDHEVQPQWKPSIHMARRLSRLTLEITDVRVQRLQDISEEDAKAEGLQASKSVEMKDGPPCYTLPFQILWNRIYGCDAWEKNPYVWALSFRVLTPNPSAER